MKVTAITVVKDKDKEYTKEDYDGVLVLKMQKKRIKN